jgi:UPF0716 protein FxsA
VVLTVVVRAIGPWWTLALLVLFVVIGAVLVRRESSRTWRALRGAVETGRMPGRELADASLVLVGGLLMLLPGFVSDVLGLLLILPFSRGASRRLLAAVLGARVVTVLPGPAGSGTGARWPGRSPRGSAQGDIIEGEVIAEEPPADDNPTARG